MSIVGERLTPGRIRSDLAALCSAGDYVSAYFRIEQAGVDPATMPGPWEFLALRCHEAGRTELAHRIWDRLWDAGHRSGDVALGEARVAIDGGRPALAAYYIEEVFGPDPEDAHARDLLADALAETDPDRAYDLLREAAEDDPDAAARAVDILRGNDRLIEAAALADRALDADPDDLRFAVRRARVHESLGEWDRALTRWQEIAERHPRARSQALMNQVRLYSRLDRSDLAIAAAARHALTDPPLGERIRVAHVIGLDREIPLLLDAARRAGAAAGVAEAEWERVARYLLDHGAAGLVRWLADRGLPIGAEPRALVEAFPFSRAATDVIAEGPYEAAGVTSPDCLLPLPRIAGPGWLPPRERRFDPRRDRVLLVNSTLTAGGAERQFVILARALLLQGVPPGNLHVALFSSAADRGHAHFLPELRLLGIPIHELEDRPAARASLPERLSAALGMLPTPLRNDVARLWGPVERIAPDVLHGWQDRAALACGMVGYLQSVRCVALSARNMSPDRRGDRTAGYGAALMSELCRQPSVAISANSDPGARDYERWLGVPPGTVRTVSNAVDPDEFPMAAPWVAAPQGSDRPLRIGGVFRLAANKRPELWLRTVARLSKISRYLIEPKLIGRGPFLDEILARKQELGLDRLTVQTQLNRPAEIYGNFDVKLLMSRVEGTPNVLLEAQASGLPVAACDVGGVRDAMLPDGPAAGLLLHPDIEPEEAAERIEAWLPGALAADPEDRRRFVAASAGLSVLGDRTLALYRGDRAATWLEN